ncbi:redoxin domain-containing protein [Nonomuraea africana]|uniref:Thiol-disulfide isomerase/thioredoxin n=1 Tax=Nonomuraea africana TaxID=46171 RepID=A0ABR9KBW6_9ACTN|nr:redoxin domain-containing protein [Nonomuraea africana]MBE1559501.1 thiol-disulfide isomerase/thioredoxin [Nonomuraea africana]
MITLRVGALLASAALLVSACGSAGPGDAATPARGEDPMPVTVTSAPAPSTPAPSQATTAPVPAALAFSATTLDGAAFQGASLAGRPVVFWFWAPWCPKCRSEAPAVKVAAVKYDKVAFVGVAGLDTESAMKEFVQRTRTGDIIHLADTKGAVWTKLGVSEQSTFVFMRPDGSTEKASGPLGHDELDGHLRKLLEG